MEKKYYWYKDIRIWIVLFFFIRLYGINFPPLETLHNWRQTTVAMVARNFLEDDSNIFFPRVDFAGDKTGITGMEFPLFNYIIYLVSEFFGYQHWYGRLINLIFSSVGVWFFYKTVLLHFNKRLAFYASIILLSSVWFVYSRKIMPDTFSMSMVLMGFYYAYIFLMKKRNYGFLVLYGFFTLCGLLSKLPSFPILSLLIPLLFMSQAKNKDKVYFVIVSISILIPVCYWYFVWVPHLVEKFGFWHFFMGKPIEVSIYELSRHLGPALEKFYDSALKFIGFAVFVFGLFSAVKAAKKELILIFAISFIAFLVVVLKSGVTFATHDYYMIPFAPIMALIAGYGLECIPNGKVVLLLLIGIVVENIANKQHDFRIKEKNERLLALEDILDLHLADSALVFINSGPIPTPMYFAHRKGWIGDNAFVKKESNIEQMKFSGLKGIVILKRTFGTDIQLPYEEVYNSEDYRIYRLD